MSAVIGWVCLIVGLILIVGGRADIGVLWNIQGAIWFVVAELEQLNRNKNK